MYLYNNSLSKIEMRTYVFLSLGFYYLFHILRIGESFIHKGVKWWGNFFQLLIEPAHLHNYDEG